MTKLTILLVKYFSIIMMETCTIYLFLLFPGKDIQWRQNRTTKLTLANIFQLVDVSSMCHGILGMFNKKTSRQCKKVEIFFFFPQVYFFLAQRECLYISGYHGNVSNDYLFPNV